MAVDKITVRKKNNHNITRNIQASALKIFERKGWEAVNDSSASIAASPKPETKKKDVAPVEDPVKDEQDETKEPFAPFGGEGEGDSKSELETLREEYQILSGKAADKRWKETKLKEEIEKLSTNASN